MSTNYYSMVSNPKKVLSVNFPIDKVREAVKNISLINRKYIYNSENDIFNQYRYESFEFLSWGVFIDINLNALSENKTEITFEIIRKIGAFDHPAEVADASRHIAVLIDIISKLTASSSEDIHNLRIRQERAQIAKETAKRERIEAMKAKFRRRNKTAAAILALLLGFAGAHRIYLGQRSKGYLMAVFFWTLIPSIIGIIDFFAFLFMSKEKFDAKYNKPEDQPS